MNCWKKAKEMHDQLGLNFQDAFDYYRIHGYIISTPTSLIWGEQLKDTWLVYLAIGENSIKQFIEQQPFWLPKFAFCRLLKNRHKLKVYSMNRIARYYNIDISKLQRQAQNNQAKLT